MGAEGKHLPPEKSFTVDVEDVHTGSRSALGNGSDSDNSTLHSTWSLLLICAQIESKLHVLCTVVWGGYSYYIRQHFLTRRRFLPSGN